MARESSP